jgi:multidrug efflux pump subunit AcrB
MNHLKINFDVFQHFGEQQLMNLPRLSVQNPVAANLLMWGIVVAGLYYWFAMLREFFPNVEPEQIVITIPYPGATPEEVEKTITRKVEQKIDALRDVKKVESLVVEGVTAMTVTLEQGADRTRALNDLRSEIDKVRPELPDDVEEPELIEVRPFIPVIAVVLYGDVAEENLRREAIAVKDDLLNLPGISEILTSGIRKREIWIEVRTEKLEEFGLTFEQVGRAMAQANLDLSGGQLKSKFGNIRVRTLGENNRASVIQEIIVYSRPDGTTLRLKDIAYVRDTFEDKVERGHFARKHACTITIFKAPEQDTLKIAAQVKEYAAKNPTRLNGAVRLQTITDLSRYIVERLQLMTSNAKSGFILVVLALALFLDLRVALWVAAGVPTSLLGAFVVMYWMGVTINLMSLFAIILVLGMLVDDAIVVGENIYTKMQQGMPPLEAAVEGANEVAMPVIAAMATTVAAFLPLSFIEGRMGAFLAVLPLVVIAALIVSLFEAFAILPAHLGHRRQFKLSLPVLGVMAKKFAHFRDVVMEQAMSNFTEKMLRFFLRWRYATLAGVIGFSLAVLGLVAADIIPFVLFPKIDAETILVRLEMVAGTSETVTEDTLARLEQMITEFPEVKSVFAVVGIAFSERGREAAADPATVGQISLELLTAETREARGLRNSVTVINEMRRRAGNILGVKKLEFAAQSGGPGGADIEVRVRGDNFDTLIQAAAYVRSEVGTYPGITELDDDLKQGKQELQLRMKDSAYALGLSTRTLALQVRHALFGFEAQKIQEETEELKIRVLLPEGSRHNIASLARLRIATPNGARVPLQEVADLAISRGYATLSRVDGKRAVTVRAQVDETIGNVSQITSELEKRLADIGARFAGISVSFEGQRKETRESLGSLAIGFPAALLLIYMILAVLFHSYTQPIIIMMAIPYSLIGVIIGHWMLDYPLTLMSLIGCVALSGVVVNDSLVLVDFINRLRGRGTVIFDAVIIASRGRLRAILLTSITTVFGLLPLMFQKSLQAKFLIPMAIALVFGLSFSTILTLFVIPALYLMLDDFHRVMRWLWTGKW